MTSRRRTTIKASTDPQACVLAFTKAIQGVTKSQDNFSKNVEGLESLIAETFSELELKLDAKQKELSSLEERFTHDERSKKLEVDLNVREHGYEAATRILEERGEVAVPKITNDELKRMYEELKATRDSEIESAVEREQERNNKHVVIIKQTLELKNQAEVATVQAQLESQVVQIQVLNKTIDRITHDLDAQRSLTKDVAMASAKQMPMYVPHNSGSGRN
jgi:hypothetical protein